MNLTVRAIACLSAAWALTLLPGATRAQDPRPTTTVPSCVTSECHGEVLSGKVLHGPAAQRKCDACHTLSDPEGHLFTPTFARSELCAFCHVQTHKTFQHEPVAEGDCLGCHDPHGSDHRFMLIDDPARGLCFRCHEADLFKSKKYLHGPVAAGACIVCHEAHSSWTPKLLAHEEKDLCAFCHDTIQDPLKTVRHPHQPVLEGRCLTCHDPHCSDHPAQLRGGAPGLCYSCHEHEAMKELVENASHVHGALTGEDSCTICHLGHGGMMPKLLREPLMQLCLSCHSEQIVTDDGRQLTDMAKLLKDNPNHHGPVNEANCSACHDPHASENFGLLRKAYPALFYSPFDLKNYELCLDCHLKELVLDEEGFGVTGFRNGNLNLHFVHVNQEKGRTCRACHEVHASKRPFHIREKVPFGRGGWEMDINFTALPDGGSCLPGCHEKVTYSRSLAENPHDAKRDSDGESDR